MSTVQQRKILTPQHPDISLPGKGAHLLVAVSGGADSVALLHLLHDSRRQKGWRLTVAHLDHGIRGEAARRDAEFVRALARRLRLPCVLGRARVPALARRRGLSLEMAAREARYAFLVRAAGQVGADTIATAHTADDQAETVLLKLIRGAGRGGLSGIKGVSRVGGIPLIRPILPMTRADIEAYLRERKIHWREDESNFDRAFLRNRVRHELLPLLERDYNPKIRQALIRAAGVLGAEDDWMDELAAENLAECMPAAAEGEGGVNATRLGGYPLAARRRMIRLWLAGRGIPESSLDFDSIARIEAQARRTRGSGTVELHGGWRVRRHYEQLTVSLPAEADEGKAVVTKPVRLTIPGVTVIPEWGLSVTATLAQGVVRERGGRPGVLPARATFSKTVWRQRVVRIRLCRAGDRIAPFGIRGTCKLQDILVDAKVPRSDRPRIPVLECGRQLIWVPGYRIARDWAVGNESRDNLHIRVDPIG